MSTRRVFLTQAGLSILGFGAIGSQATSLAETLSTLQQNEKITQQNNKVLVIIFQRGAMDGLMALQPFTDPYFMKARTRLRMTKDDGIIPLNDTFALHPAFGELTELYTNKQLCFVHGVGSPSLTRSHFDAQDYMENGTPNKKSSSGWLNRVHSTLHSSKASSPFSLLSMTSSMPLSVVGDSHALVIENLKKFSLSVQGAPISSRTANSFESLYEDATQEFLRTTSKDSFRAIETIKQLDVDSYTPTSGLHYPQSAIGNHLKDVAQLIKARAGVEIVFIESNGWDTHVQQGTKNGLFARNAADLSAAIKTFWLDLGSFSNNVTLMTMTEFGRTVAENGSGGTDHGRASVMMVLNNSVRGGTIYGTVPTLAPENLADGRDLPVTTDFRSVCAGVLQGHYSQPLHPTVFPEWNGNPLKVF